MHIPKTWLKISADCFSRERGGTIPVTVWGWGDEAGEARRNAESRLDRLVKRLRLGEPAADGYSYGDRPVREEILDTFEGAGEGQSDAVLTRNRYGAQILNTAWMLFLDIDLPPLTFMQRIRRLFSATTAGEDALALAKLRENLQRLGDTTFRVYRTAAGLRAIAIDRRFDPRGSEAQALMQATGTDACFANLCRLQESFRARLTPKPWRCGMPMPPGTYPREDAMVQRRFADWVGRYEQASNKHATCRYLETIGTGSCDADTERLIAIHDRVTRCDAALPLA